MFEDITKPSTDELLKQIKEIEHENNELDQEIICQRRRLAKDFDDLEEMAHVIKKCENELGEEKIKQFHEEVKKEKQGVDVEVELEEDN